MEKIFLILVILVGGLRETEATSITGVLEGEITVECTHNNAFSNFKYFCKGKCQNEDILIQSSGESEVSQGKYRIVDKGSTFSVTISHLTEDDSGTYWCGIERIGFDTYNKVVITVIKGDIQHNDLLQSGKLLYIGAGLGVVVLALVIVLLIFFRQQNKCICASSGRVHKTANATSPSLKQDTRHITTASPTTEDEDKDGRNDTNCSLSAVHHQYTSKDGTDNFYSNVSLSSEAQNRPGSFFYSTVSFNKDWSTVTPQSAVVTYSTLAYISTDETAIYDNI